MGKSRVKQLMIVVIILILISTMVACKADQPGDVGSTGGVDKENVETDENVETNGDGNEGLEAQTPEEPVGNLDMAYNFKLKDLDGNEVNLSDFKGKQVLLNFWATWCQWCDKEMPDLQKFHENYGDEIVVIGVNSMEDSDTVKEYVENGGYTFLVVMDTDGSVSGTEYYVTGLPTTVYVDRDGTLIGGVSGAISYDDMVEIYEDIK